MTVSKNLNSFIETLRGYFKEAVETSRIRTERAYYMPQSSNFVPGILTIGDALSLRDPCTASGMTIALKDATSWRNLLQHVPNLYNYDAMYAAYNIFSLERKSYVFTNDLFTCFFKCLTVPKTSKL